METVPAAFLLDIPFISRNSHHHTRFNSASVKQTKSRGKKSQILKLAYSRRAIEAVVAYGCSANN
jgi:hypothetical protein